MRPGAEAGGQPLRGEHGADGHTGAEPFRQRHDVRGDATLLVGEQRAEAPHARLHFVEDQQQVARIAQLAHPAQVIRLRHDDAAFAL